MSRPVFISAGYIVRDEEDVLAESLASVAPYVDEIVVYDTGSVDRTVEIARAAGATVVEGYWDDDFGAARNRAVGHCSGRWVVMVDADETISGDPRAFRRALWNQTDDMLTSEVRSRSWGQLGRPVLSMIVRIFRRDLCEWQGRLHEQVVAKRGHSTMSHMPHLVIEHGGYTLERVDAKDKGRRNLDVSLSALEEAEAIGATEHLDKLHNDIARSAVIAGDAELAAAHFGQIDRTRARVGTVVTAGRSALPCLVGQGLLDEADSWLVSLREAGESRQMTTLFEAQIARGRGATEDAVRLLRSLRDDTDFYGLEFSRWAGSPLLIECLVELGRFAEACEATLDLVGTGRSNLAAVQVLALVSGVPDGLSQLLATIDDDIARHYLGELQAVPAHLGDSYAEALWAAGRLRSAALVWAASAWSTHAVDRAILWSLRLREAGLAHECPLRRVLHDHQTPLTRRVVAGSVLMEIGEDQWTDLLGGLLADVDDVEEALVAIRRHAPAFAARLAPA